MADKNIAWSQILTGVDDKGKPTVINWGDSVSASAVGGEEELELLRNEGIVRDYAPPKEWVEQQQANVSPVRYMLDEQARLADAAAGGPSFGGSVAAPPLEEVLLGVGAGAGMRAAVEEGTPTEEVDTMKARIAELEKELAAAKK